MVALLLAVACPAAAFAHGASLRQTEAALLGPEHAREHTAQREALRRWQALPRAERAELRRRAERRLARASARIAAELPAPDQVGRWESRTIPFPTYAINTVVVPTGEVLFWGRSPIDPGTGKRENVTEVWLWNPASGAFTEVQPPRMDLDGDGQQDDPAPLFCSGQSLLATGEVLITGGNLAYPDVLGPDYAGLDRIYTFDPWARRWTEQPRMSDGRWYPSQVELPDGRTVIVAGYDATGSGEWNSRMEIFTPASVRGGRGTLAEPIAGSLISGTYPHVFTLPDGHVLLTGHDTKPAGAQAALLDTAKLGDPGWSAAWSAFERLGWYAKASQAALLLGDRGSTPHVTVIGGYGTSEATQTSVSTAATMVVGEDGWTSDLIPNQNKARAYANLVELPDGSLVTVGGGAGTQPGGADQNYTAGDQDLKQVELLRPGLDHAWRPGPAQRKWRSYHSTAVLLPDGRVLSAGDDYWSVVDTPDPYTHPDGEPLDQAEIYEPPYLFDGDQPAPRPQITSLPPMGATGGVRYGERFAVGVANRQAQEAVLMAPGATTHGVNMSQRRIELEVVSSQPGGIEVRAPQSAAVAPPGWYMLFVVDAAGTPSEAGWVWLRTSRPPSGGDLEAPVPPARPAAPAPPAPPGPSPAVDWNAPGLRIRVLAPARRGRLVPVRVTASEPAKGVLRPRAGARRLRAKAFSIARAGGRRTLRLAMPARAVRALRAGRRLRLTVAVDARDKTGNRARRRASAWLRLRS